MLWTVAIAICCASGNEDSGTAPVLIRCLAKESAVGDRCSIVNAVNTSR